MIYTKFCISFCDSILQLPTKFEYDRVFSFWVIEKTKFHIGGNYGTLRPILPINELVRRIRLCNWTWKFQVATSLRSKVIVATAGQNWIWHRILNQGVDLSRLRPFSAKNSKITDIWAKWLGDVPRTYAQKWI